MRIYEFSQQNHVSNKDVIEKLQQNGFDVKNHMSILNDEALVFLSKAFSAKNDESNNEAVSSINSKPIKSIEKTVSISNNTTTVSQKKSKFKESTHQIDAVSKEQMPFLLEQMSIDEVAQKINKSVTEIIVLLLKWGVLVTKNQVVSEDLIKRILDHYEIAFVKPLEKRESLEKEKRLSQGGELKERPPVVVIVGHVDHGKTTLLDYIRKTRVAHKEKGGITQHLGAYEATTSHGNIVFLDTPGHEAFGKIRQRGIRVADIVVLVVAADDGVMPQTVEAIKHALSMQVPIVVAINKIDKVDASRLDIVKRQLNQHGITVEDWGGDTVCVPISAKTGMGVDLLLEMIALQAEIMELRAEINVPASGYVLESGVEKGRGSVATVITQNGILKIGDYFICGNTSGHISSLIDSYGQRVKKTSPAIPVQVAGFDGRPEAGDFFEVVSKEEYLKSKSSGDGKRACASKRFMYENGINLLVKADNHSSLEAVVEAIDKLSKKATRGFNILRQEVGDVSENDVEFAFNTSAHIVCFNIKTESNAGLLAERRKISIMHFGIIYKLLEELARIAELDKKIEMVRTKIGDATVLRVFDIKKIGVIAGSIINNGKFVRDGYVVVLRGRSKVGEGKITSLQRDKKTVKEVNAGFECGFMVSGFSDWMVDDKVECYIDLPKK